MTHSELTESLSPVQISLASASAEHVPAGKFVPLPLGERDTEAPWDNLLEKLAKRREQFLAFPADTASQNGATGKIMILARWLRPRLVLLAAAACRFSAFVARKTWGIISDRGFWQSVRTKLETVLEYFNGWLRWHWRKVRTDRETRLAVLGVTGGFSVSFGILLLLLHFFPPSSPEVLPLDPFVPVPQLAMIEAIPGQDRETLVVESESDPLPQNLPLSPDTFRFEQFARITPSGRTELLSRTVRHHLLAWYPVGAPAASVLRFFGRVMQRSGSTAENAAASARQHCMNFPLNKVFTATTMACTYSHALSSGQSRNKRVFWIVALSYDRAGNLMNLDVHAGEARAIP
jgi:hypothetical protein